MRNAAQARLLEQSSVRLGFKPVHQLWSIDLSKRRGILTCTRTHFCEKVRPRSQPVVERVSRLHLLAPSRLL